MSDLKKNDEFELEITDMGSDGEGIGHAEGMAFFVKGAIPGDRILAGVTKLKKTYGYARIVEILRPSENRVKPMCPVASRCGGCSLWHMDYKAQLDYKQKKVRDTLERIGGLGKDRADKTVFYDIIGMDDPFHYRNKGQFPVGVDKNGKTVCGFYAGHSHDIIDTESCLIQHPVTDGLMMAVRDFISAHRPLSGVFRHVLTRVGFTTHEIMVCAVIAADELSYREDFIKLLSDAVSRYNKENESHYSLSSVSYNINKEDTNVIMGDKVVNIYGATYITDHIGGLKYRISPLSFYQVNPRQTEKLYSKVLEFAAPKDTDIVWDLYCGIGTISLFLAKHAGKVIGIEIVPAAVEDAKENARLNGIDNAEFHCGAAEDLLPGLIGRNKAVAGDIVVVDPPRKGCDEKLLSSIHEISPKRLVYVSCDPATLARDIKLLAGYGYEVLKVQPVEMFALTSHVEVCCLLEQQM